MTTKIKIPKFIKDSHAEIRTIDKVLNGEKLNSYDRVILYNRIKKINDEISCYISENFKQDIIEC